MTRIKFILLSLLATIVISCATEKHKFPLDKRYWDTNDYAEVVKELKYGYEKDETLPTFDNPETRIIVQKLTDEQNFKIVLDDKELGLKHKNNVAETFFMRWKDMMDIYPATDRKDKYLYDEEMIAVWQFGLGLQLKYFTLGNEKIKEGADDPSSSRVKNVMDSNISTLINNYLIYLDEINEESAYSEQGLDKLATGIDKYFTELIDIYPEADYRKMKSKAELMLKKSNSDRVKSSLNKLIELIDSKEIEIVTTE